VALSFITAITATKTMLRALAGVKAFKNHKLYGVKGGAA